MAAARFVGIKTFEDSETLKLFFHSESAPVFTWPQTLSYVFQFQIGRCHDSNAVHPGIQHDDAHLGIRLSQGDGHGIEETH